MGFKKSVMCHVLPVMFHVSCVIHNMSAASVTCNPKIFKNPKMFQTSNTKNGFLSFAILLFTKSLQSMRFWVPQEGTIKQTHRHADIATY